MITAYNIYTCLWSKVDYMYSNLFLIIMILVYETFWYKTFRSHFFCWRKQLSWNHKTIIIYKDDQFNYFKKMSNLQILTFIHKHEMFVKHLLIPLPLRPLRRKWKETAKKKKKIGIFLSPWRKILSKIVRSYPKPNLT